MSETDRLAISYSDHPVWVALTNHSIGPEGADLSFGRRLARENGWSDAHAARVIGEYKRFCFLAVTAGHEVTPSDAVDQAWHLHLTHTRDYWERFCPHVLARPLHHSPTAGGRDAQHRFFQQYAQTLKSYARIFGENAPSDLWPKAAQRLVEDPKARRVHPRDGFVIRRWQAAVVGLVVAAIFVVHVVYW
jgi:hypothetical protein